MILIKRLAAAAFLVAGSVGAQGRTSAAPMGSYEVFALRYASIPFKVNGLIADADSSRHMDIAMTIWLMRGRGRTVVLDAGFKRADMIARYKPTGYVRPDSALLGVGVKATDVTDLIISHIHWDHFDGADLFPNAKIWIQREEVEYYIDTAGKVLHAAIDRQDAVMLNDLRKAGRLQLVDGDAKEIIPGITVYTGGKHTFQSQYVGVKTADATIVLASDNMYLYENLDRHVPIAQTLDAASNLAAQDRMRTLASELRLIIPGHDPEVFKRFTLVAPNVVRIK